MTWSGTVRRALSAHRDAGLPFVRAWRLAVPAAGRLPGIPLKDQVKELSWHEAVFREGYERRPVLAGRASQLADELEEDRDPGVGFKPRRPEGSCQWGAGCEESGEPGATSARFCPSHRAVLARCAENVPNRFLEAA